MTMENMDFIEREQVIEMASNNACLELEPLEANHPRHQPHRPRLSRHVSRYSSRCYEIPFKVLKLVALLVLLPTVFILVPLYMRYRVFQSQMYPMGMTDMRLIDGKISPTWCQRQLVRSNSTFNAFVVPGPPAIANELVPVSMTRELRLEDDMKEYWGFYLLKGSTVTVAACVRSPGASLIMIKGYKHLKDCAYIGDDSSEEVDELQLALAEGRISKMQFEEEIKKLEIGEEGKANSPDSMTRVRAGVRFVNSQSTAAPAQGDDGIAREDAEHDPKELSDLLSRLHEAREAAKAVRSKLFRPPEHLLSYKNNRHRDTNVDKEERQYLSIKDLDGKSNENNSTDEVNTSESREPKSIKKNTKQVKEIKIETSTVSSSAKVDVSTEKANIVEEKTIVDKHENAENSTEDTSADKQSSETSSKEIFEDVLNRLQNLGPRGKRILKRLHETMITEDESSPEYGKLVMSKLTGSEAELDRLKKVLVEAIDEEKTRDKRQKKRKDAVTEARKKRELYLQKVFNEDDESRNKATEEGLDPEPDGYADHHTLLNESTPLDMSRSEFWSSFSSSEERLLECEGLILNLPLSPSLRCEAEASESDRRRAAQKNAVTYRVPSNGYYFFVFNSENEVNVNYINVRFDLQKTRYDIARTALRQCQNATEPCALLLDIFSSQKVVLELPLMDNASMWSEQFVVVSECEPRTSVYLACAIAVPVLILVFAFQ